MTGGLPAYVEFRGDFKKLGKEVVAKVRPMASEFGKMAVSQSKAGKQTTLLDRGTRRLGGSLSRAARYAIGAAAAYVSIAKGKEAITTTLDLSKSTAGLNRNLGLSVNVASRWGAVAKARDIDSKSMTMSFTILSKRMVEAAHKGGTAMESFNRLGISQGDVERGSRDFEFGLMRVAKAFGAAEGGAKRQVSAQQLLGRGYTSILPLFSEGTKSLKEQLHWADEYGATLDSKTNDSLMELVSLQRESKVASLGLQVAFTKALTPALVELHDQYQGVVRLWARDDISDSRKWEILGRRIERLADKGLVVFERLLPQAANQAGRWGPKVAKAFLEGFIAADAWGKLALGGFLLAKMGGPQAVSGSGTKAGKHFGKGFMAGAAIGLILSLPDIEKAIDEIWDKVEDKIDEKSGLFGDIVSLAADATDKAQISGTPFGVLKDAGKIGGFANEALEVPAPKTDRAEKRLREWAKSVGRESNRARVLFHKGITPMPGVAGTTGANINKALLPKLDQLVNVGGQKSRQFRGNVGGPIQGLSGDVAGALRNININISKALEAYGAARMPQFKLKGLVNQLPTVGELERQKGGIVPGRGDGDRPGFAAAVGSFVLNREATGAFGFRSGGLVPLALEAGERLFTPAEVHAIGRGKLEAMNAAVPRQTGGNVGLGPEPQILGPNPLRSLGQRAIQMVYEGGQAYLRKHMRAVSGGDIVTVGKSLQHLGYEVGEHPAFGGVNAVHTDGSAHYRAAAFDVNDDAPPYGHGRSEMASLDWLAPQLKKLPHSQIIWRNRDIDTGASIPAHMDHLHFAMMLGGLVQRLAEGGFAKGTYTVKGNAASAAQKLVEEKIMRASDQVSANHLARVAITMAGIQESELGAASSNIFQLTGSNFGMNPSDVTATALYWLKKGYYGKGGGLELSKTMSSPGAIAQAVEGSNFPHAYDPWKSESQEWVDGWTGSAAGRPAEKDIPKQIKGSVKGGKTSKGGGTFGPGHYKVSTDRLGSFGSLPSNLEACTKELRIRQRELGEYRAAAAHTKDPDVRKALKANAQMLEARIAALRTQRRRLIREAATKKAVAKIAKAANFEAWTNPETGIFARSEDAYEEAQERAEQAIALEPDEPASGATADWVDKVLKSYVEGTESPAFGRVLGTEGDRRNAFISAQEFARNRTEEWRVQMERLQHEIGFIRALKQSDPKAYARRKDEIPGKQARMKALREDIQKTRGTTLPEWEEALGGVQGRGRSHELLGSLPTIPTGEFGGDIFQTQLSIKELLLKVPQALQGLEQGGGKDDAARLAAVEDLLRQANQRNIARDIEESVFAGLPRLHTGGVVPGPPTQEKTMVLTGQERVRTPEQEIDLAEGIRGLGGQPSVTVNFFEGEGAEVLVNGEEVDARINHYDRHTARRVRPDVARAGVFG